MNLKKSLTQISLKNGYEFEIYLNQDEQVYKKITELHQGDNDLLVVSNEQVCFYNETFGQFNQRIQNTKILSIQVISLQDTYNRLNSHIDNLQRMLNQLQSNYSLLQNQYKELDQQLKQSQSEEQRNRNPQRGVNLNKKLQNKLVTLKFQIQYRKYSLSDIQYGKIILKDINYGKQI